MQLYFIVLREAPRDTGSALNRLFVRDCRAEMLFEAPLVGTASSSPDSPSFSMIKEEYIIKVQVNTGYMKFIYTPTMILHTP